MARQTKLDAAIVEADFRLNSLESSISQGHCWAAVTRLAQAADAIGEVRGRMDIGRMPGAMGNRFRSLTNEFRRTCARKRRR